MRSLHSLRPVTLSLFTVLLAACSSAGTDPASQAAEGALAPGAAKGTLLVSEGDGALQLRFGVAADQKTPIVTVSRDGKSRTLHCESYIDLEQPGRAADQVGISCTEDLVAGYDWCEVALERTGSAAFDLDVSCDYSSGRATSLPDSLAQTYAVLAGEPAPNASHGRKSGIKLVERERASGPLADEIAFTEALVEPLRALLTKKQTVVDFHTRAVTEVGVTRVSAHPAFADHAMEVSIFATSYSAHADKLSVVGDGGTFASSSEIVSRAVSTARCVEGPANLPNCVH